MADWYDSSSNLSIPSDVRIWGSSTAVKMNRKFAALSLNDLVERLSDCTLRYSKMHMSGGREQDFYRIKKDILELQQEIVRRKESEDSDRHAPPNDRFADD